MTSQLQIVSDVHLEFRRVPPYIPRAAPNLALLGDIGKPFMTSYARFLTEQSKRFDNVFLIMGNHEYDNNKHTVDEILAKARAVCSNIPNVHLLERDSYDLTDQTTLLGCTLWSNIQPHVVKHLNDFKKILVERKQTLSPCIYNSWHRRDVTWLDQAITVCHERGRKAIVLTHHGPLHAMSGEYLNSPLSSGFTTDLFDLFREPVVAFASGHVHSNVDITRNDIRSVSNALGYPKEETGYKSSVVVDVP